MAIPTISIISPRDLSTATGMSLVKIGIDWDVNVTDFTVTKIFAIGASISLDSLSADDTDASLYTAVVQLHSGTGGAVRFFIPGNSVDQGNITTQFYFFWGDEATPSTTSPDAPTAVTVAVTVSTATVAWQPPENNGGSEITGYQVRYQEGAVAGGTWVDAGDVTELIISNLDAGTQYTFDVRAVNDIGNSVESDAVTVSTTAAPATVPGAPTGVRVATTHSTAMVSWIAPVSDVNSDITGYRVRHQAGAVAGGDWVDVGDVTEFLIRDLEAGTQYTFDVQAVNSVGNSPESDSVTVSTAPAVVPGVPTGVTVTVTTSTATVSWIEPVENGGSEIIGYRVRHQEGAVAGGVWVATGSTDTTLEILNLEYNTQYTFDVQAVNGVGNSMESEPVTETTQDIPFVLGFAVPTDRVGNIFEIILESTHAVTDVDLSDMVLRQSSPTAFYALTRSPVSTTLTPITGTHNYLLSITLTGTFDSDFIIRLRPRLLSYNGDRVPSETLNSDVFHVDTNLNALSVPRNLVLTPTATGIAAAWEIPTDTGDSAISGYEVQINEGAIAGGAWVATGGTALTHTFANLKKATQYTVSARAVNAEGSGIASAGVSTTTLTTVPGAATSLAVTVTRTSATLRWVAPSDTGGEAINYQVRINQGAIAGGTWIDTDSDETTHIFENLTPETQYTFDVRVANSQGEGLPSSSVTETTASRTVPSVPTSLAVTTGIRTATASWGPVADDGDSDVTHFDVRYQPGGEWLRVLATVREHMFLNLDPNTDYTFEVRAINSIGAGAAASLAKRTEPIPPAVATITFSVSRGVGGVALTVNVNFDKDVNDIDDDDLSATAGTLGSVSGTGGAYEAQLTPPATGDGNIEVVLRSNAVTVGNARVSASIAYAEPVLPPAIESIGEQNIVVDTPYELTVRIRNNPSKVYADGKWQDFYHTYTKNGTIGILKIIGRPEKLVKGEKWKIVAEKTGFDNVESEIIFNVIPAAPVITRIGRQTIYKGVETDILVPIANKPTVVDLRGPLLDLGFKRETELEGVRIIGEIPENIELSITEGVGNITASNAGGVDEYGMPFDIRDTPTAPGVPRSLSATLGDRQLTFTWQAPISGGTLGTTDTDTVKSLRC